MEAMDTEDFHDNCNRGRFAIKGMAQVVMGRDLASCKSLITNCWMTPSLR